LLEAFGESGIDFRDVGDVTSFRWRPDPARPKAMNLPAVVRSAQSVAAAVAEAMRADEAVLVLGGDCTIELGTIAGALSDSTSVGLIYIDLDADLNTPQTSDGALDWTGVAHLLDLSGTADELSGMAGRRPMLGPGDVLYVGLDNTTAAEASAIDRSKIEVIELAAVLDDPITASRHAVEWGLRFERLFVHVDVDVLEFAEFPIAEEVRRRRGLTLDQLFDVVRAAVQSPNCRGLTIAEVNPDHAPDEAASFRRLIEKMCATFQA
jgi:arginase